MNRVLSLSLVLVAAGCLAQGFARAESEETYAERVERWTRRIREESGSQARPNVLTTRRRGGAIGGGFRPMLEIGAGDPYTELQRQFGDCAQLIYERIQAGASIPTLMARFGRDPRCRGEGFNARERLDALRNAVDERQFDRFVERMAIIANLRQPNVGPDGQPKPTPTPGTAPTQNSSPSTVAAPNLGNAAPATNPDDAVAQTPEAGSDSTQPEAGGNL